jgi:hypothetical protein
MVLAHADKYTTFQIPILYWLLWLVLFSDNLFYTDYCDILFSDNLFYTDYCDWSSFLTTYYFIGISVLNSWVYLIANIAPSRVINGVYPSIYLNYPAVYPSIYLN